MDEIGPQSCSSDSSSHEEYSDIDEPSTSTGINNSKRMAKTHKCCKCDFVAKFPNKLRIHIERKHSEAPRFKCAQCDNLFHTYIDLRKHRAADHPIIHRCIHCDYTNKKPAFVKRHIMRMHENGVSCSIAGCNAKVAKNRLKRHIKECHSDDSKEVVVRVIKHTPKCPHCDYIPDKTKTDDQDIVDDINLHVESIHKAGVKCPYGCAQMLDMNDLDSHVAENHAVTIIDDEKPKNFNGFYGLNKAEMSDETATNTTTTMAPTETCSYDISEHIDLDSRSSSDYEDADDDDYVGDSGSDKEKKNVVLDGVECTEYYIKDFDDRFECRKCSKKFVSKRSLKKHINGVHEKVYNYIRVPKRHECKWEDCGKVFRFKCLLEDHMNKHKGLKPYECDKCKQSFFARSQFAVHLRKYHKTSIKDYDFIARQLLQKGESC